MDEVTTQKRTRYSTDDSNDVAWRRQGYYLNRRLDGVTTDLLRELTDREKEKAITFNAFVGDTGRFPNSDEIELDDICQNLFPLNLRIDPLEGIRRLAGFPGNEYSGEECAESIRRVSARLNSARDRGALTLPRARDMRKAISLHISIPSLATSMPDPDEIVRALGVNVWAQAVQNVLHVSDDEIHEQLVSQPTLDDFIDGYNAAFAYFYGAVIPDDDRLVSYRHLDQFYSEVPFALEADAFREFFAELAAAGALASLNDLRHRAGKPQSLEYEGSERRTPDPFTDGEFLTGFVAAWELDGLDGPPPSMERLNEISVLQNNFVRRYGSLAAYEYVYVVPRFPVVRVPSEEEFGRNGISMDELIDQINRPTEASPQPHLEIAVPSLAID